ncbi:MAG: S-layer homology domain-containing protein [Firmicutes bacterium]|nr:S-layer homology domain-containing protein [Bacillota bacterium]
MKFLKYFLCITIFLSSISIVYAADDRGITEALTIVKERIDTSAYENFESSFYKDDDGVTSYSFDWTNEGDSYAGLYITYKDGIITNYSKYDYRDDETAGRFSLTDEEAKSIAGEFLKKINPSICENIVMETEENQSIHYDAYNINLYRIENGIPVLGEYGNIEVSKQRHEVSHFYINYASGINFKPLEKIISAEDAKKAYMELVPASLRYKYKADYDKKEISAYIEYASKDGTSVINAYDGTLYKAENGDRYLYNSLEEKSMASDSDGGFSPAELSEIEKIAGLLTEAQAENKARENKIIGIFKDFEKNHASFNRNRFNKDEYVYNFSFSTEEDYIGVNIDAKTGEILSFYKSVSKDFEDKQNRKKEEELAKSAFIAFAGDKVSEFHMEESEYNGAVSFVRTVNGLDVAGDGAYFEFDGEDNIIGYNLSYTKGVEFPSPNGVISKDAAAEYAFDAVGFELGYSINYEDKTAQPVYYVGNGAEMKSFTMNPFTGHITDYKGDDLEKPKKITYSDIDGHYGKAAFLSLAQYGIGIEGGELKPYEPITQAEYLTLLNKAFGYDAEINEIYKRMIGEGVISPEERADNSVLTRENAAIFMIREMGAEEYAKYNDIFAQPFNDVTENKGYVAILKAKGIIKGAGDGSFYPKSTVTRGDALIMIYNYFTR